MVAALPAVVVTVSSVIGAKKVLPPSMMMPALPEPVPVRAMRAQIQDAGAADDDCRSTCSPRRRWRWRC